MLHHHLKSARKGQSLASTDRPGNNSEISAIVLVMTFVPALKWKPRNGSKQKNDSGAACSNGSRTKAEGVA